MKGLIKDQGGKLIRKAQKGKNLEQVGILAGGHRNYGSGHRNYGGETESKFPDFIEPP